MQINGRHITAMVIAVCAAAILNPASVRAASDARVNIGDTLTADAARVTAGSLAVNQDLNSFSQFGQLMGGDGRLITVTVLGGKTARIGTIALSRYSDDDTLRSKVIVDIVRPSGTCAQVTFRSTGYVGGTLISEPLVALLQPRQSSVYNYAPTLRLPKISSTTCVIVRWNNRESGLLSVAITGTIT